MRPTAAVAAAGLTAVVMVTTGCSAIVERATESAIGRQVLDAIAASDEPDDGS